MTPHEIAIRTEHREVRVPPSGHVARVTSTSEPVESHDGIPVVRTSFGEVTGLPEVSDVPVIVSSLVASALRTRPPYRVFVPDTGPDSVVRDEAGRIVAVRRLIESV
jgi:hypothetical protein